MLTIKKVYEQYKDDVFRYLVSLTHDPILSEDLVSETFISALKSLPKFRGDSGIRTWLFSIARHKWYDFLRKEKDHISFDYLTSNYFRAKTDVELLVINREVVEKIILILEKEPGRIRDIVLMRIDGFSFNEIAHKHNISESSARVIDFRAKKKIREIIEKEDLKYE